MLYIKYIFKTPEERAKGLMHTRKLDSNQCAYFEFPANSTGTFWNKNVSYPIDIAFFDDKAKLVYVQTAEADSAEQIRSPKKYKYVVESNANWFSKNNVGINTTLNEVIGGISYE